ncbi:hypothetical protein [Alloalcanivorax xenomutans]|uniref:Uncharacterized protein n=1 Tax=Alloalcanivorax xenomutans TaxID=1094342 RepID=A0A9Q3W847_9GAMM|nr:hypothetical protein [Alloalcanivorax xenomutans]MCE7510289.1 hypothetical protein [Alloalcanivorax xenomutans]
MSQALRHLKGRERTTIDNLVHCLVMADLSAQVDGMRGLFDHYMKKTATADARRQWAAFQARVQEVRREMLRLAEIEWKEDL